MKLLSKVLVLSSMLMLIEGCALSLKDKFKDPSKKHKDASKKRSSHASKDSI